MSRNAAAATDAPPIAFVDLGAQHAEVRDEIDAAIAGIIDSSAFIGGPRLEAFEEAFARFTGADFAIGVGHGTDAVKIALQVVGVGAGDVVLTVSHTFIGSVEGAVQMGAAPVFVDVDPESRTLCPSSLRRVLENECRREDGELRHVPSGRRVGAILPVHLYGQSADMAPILALAEEYGLPVVEDAAQAHGTTYRFPDGREVPCGSMGAASAFSFYPGKNLGAMGEAGAVTTNDAEHARKARILRDHGQPRKYIHEVADGGNSRLDAIQAAVLGIKLERLEGWNRRRREIAAAYRALLGDLAGSGDLELPTEKGWGHHVYHLYVVQTPLRDRLHERLKEEGVPTGFHYPVPLHLQPAFEGAILGEEPLPVTEDSARTCLSLPMHPHLTDEQVERVAASLRKSIG